MGFEFPAHVDGWLSPEEGAALAVFAAGRRVLEIGSYKGRSTLCLAHRARSVVAVDPFDGRATPTPGPTLDEFRANTAHLENLDARVGTIDKVGPSLAADFDLVFIDGAHDYTSVRKDVEWALHLLKPGGLIAFHDYRNVVNPGVDRAVDDLLADGGTLLHRVDSVALVLPPLHLVTGDASGQRVVLVMPHRGQIHAAAARAFFEYPTTRLRGARRLQTDPEMLDLMRMDMSSSVLTLNFNRLWAEALNAREAGFTHLCMLHDDVCPEPGWVDVLLDEITAHQADVVSAVVPIKSAHALTSTALGEVPPRSVFRPLRRLTMHEVYDLPETFSRDDIDLEGPPALFINTGCWVADLRKPWVERCVFRNVDRLVKVNGRWKADCVSEDWAFSIDLHGWGAKVMATRRVPLYHGHPEFHNKSAWGGWEHDERYLEQTKKPEAALAS